MSSGDASAARRRAILIPALLVTLLATGVLRGAIIEEIVARVNNRIITKSEFEERGQYILQEIYEKYSGAELDKHLRAAEETLLANLITELLLVERAETLFDLEKVRQGLIADFRKQQSIESDEELDRLLAEQGMSRADLEEQLIRLAVPQEIINYDVRRKIGVSDREIRAYYEDHPEKYVTPPTVTFREIVLFYDDGARDDALVRAGGIVEEARNGGDFLELVAERSEAGTREAGGLLGPLAESDLHPGIAARVMKMKPGDISDPIDTGRTLHIVRMEEATPTIVKPIEEVRDEIFKILQQKKFKPRFERYVRKLWKDGYVKITPKYERYLVVSPLDPTPGRPQARAD